MIEAAGTSFKVKTGAGVGEGFEKKIVFRPLREEEFDSFRHESKTDELRVMETTEWTCSGRSHRKDPKKRR